MPASPNQTSSDSMSDTNSFHSSISHLPGSKTEPSDHSEHSSTPSTTGTKSKRSASKSATSWNTALVSYRKLPSRNFELSDPEPEVVHDVDENGVSQIEACMKSMEHASLDERLSMLDRFKNEAIVQDTQAQILASALQLAATRSKLQVSGSDVPDMWPFLQKLQEILSNSSSTSKEQDFPPITWAEVSQLHEKERSLNGQISLRYTEAEGFVLQETPKVVDPSPLYSAREGFILPGTHPSPIDIKDQRFYFVPGNVQSIVCWAWQWPSENYEVDSITINFRGSALISMDLCFGEDADMRQVLNMLESIADVKVEVKLPGGHRAAFAS